MVLPFQKARSLFGFAVRRNWIRHAFLKGITRTKLKCDGRGEGDTLCREADAAEEAEAMLLPRLAVATGRRRFALAASLHQDLAMDALTEVCASSN